MNTSFNTLISYFSELLNNKYLFSLLAVFAVITSFFYIRKRAKSGFFIANKLFKILTGHKKNNPNNFINDIIDIEKANGKI